MKLEQFFFNCSQEDWGQSWNRHKDSSLGYSVVNQGCPCQAAKGNSMTLVPVNKLLHSSKLQWIAFVFVFQGWNGVLYLLCLRWGIYQWGSGVCLVFSGCLLQLALSIHAQLQLYEHGAFLCASARKQLTFSSLQALGILCLLLLGCFNAYWFIPNHLCA